MLCCLFAALLLGPFGVLAVPRANAGRDCCASDRRGALVWSAVILTFVLCSTLLLLGWSQPFRHICSLRP